MGGLKQDYLFRMIYLRPYKPHSSYPPNWGARGAKMRGTHKGSQIYNQILYFYKK
jgi:hypothetical protein